MTKTCKNNILDPNFKAVKTDKTAAKAVCAVMGSPFIVLGLAVGGTLDGFFAGAKHLWFPPVTAAVTAMHTLMGTAFGIREAYNLIVDGDLELHEYSKYVTFSVNNHLHKTIGSNGDFTREKTKSLLQNYLSCNEEKVDHLVHLFLKHEMSTLYKSHSETIRIKINNMSTSDLVNLFVANNYINRGLHSHKHGVDKKGLLDMLNKLREYRKPGDPPGKDYLLEVMHCKRYKFRCEIENMLSDLTDRL